MGLKVWLSSIEHLNKFDELFGNIELTKEKVLNRIPVDFPKMRLNNNFIPLVYFSSGILEVRSDDIIYKAKKTNSLFKKDFNLDVQLNFKIGFSEINQVGRFYIPARVEKYSIQWVRIMHTSDEIFNNLLFSVQGLGFNMSKILRENENLASAINKAINQK